MKNSLGKKAKIQLNPTGYEHLRLQILERDGWRCQHCGKLDQLEVHHIVRRSHSGADSEENLIVLCNDCHRRIHWSLRQDARQAERRAFPWG